MTAQADPLEIRHEDASDRGAFYVDRDGQRIAEQAYLRQDAQHVVIVHTEVDPSLRGQGIARRLLDALVAWARATGTKVSATCPYARKEFERDPSIRDVLS